MSGEGGFFSEALEKIGERSIRTYWGDTGFTPQVAEELKYILLNPNNDKTEEILRDFKNERKFFIGPYISDFRAEDGSCEEGDYHLEFILKNDDRFAPRRKQKIKPNTFFDGDYVMKLCNEEPVAVCSFNANLKDRVMEIKQLQGAKGSQEELDPIQWERMLVQITGDYAKTHNFDEIRIQTAKENKWSHEYNSEQFRRFELRYDVTADRMGFEKNGKYWYKGLKDNGLKTKEDI